MRRITIWTNVMCVLAAVICLTAPGVAAQDRNPGKGGRVTSRTIPVTPYLRKSSQTEELINFGTLSIQEDGTDQEVLSLRNIGNNPISLAVLVQDDVVPALGNEIRPLADFIRRLPRDSRVMVAYIRLGSLQVLQKFTTDLEKAARALRIPFGSPAVAPYNPYVEIIEALKRFESLPSGRRAMIVISDGLDTSRGLDSASPNGSIDLTKSINEAQRRGVAIHSIFAPTAVTSGPNLLLITEAQAALDALSVETGGHAFIQGIGTPVSFDPFLKELGGALTRQVALTYLSTHPKKGFHKIQVSSDRKEIHLEFPAGYTIK